MSDWPWPIAVDQPPMRYRAQLLEWRQAHNGCPGHRCLRDPARGPCPLPPAVPRFTRCPTIGAHDPRLVDCGGCEGCEPGHRCHLSGTVDFCRGGGPSVCPDNALMAWADYWLIEDLRRGRPS